MCDVLDMFNRFDLSNMFDISDMFDMSSVCDTFDVLNMSYCFMSWSIRPTYSLVPIPSSFSVARRVRMPRPLFPL